MQYSYFKHTTQLPRFQFYAFWISDAHFIGHINNNSWSRYHNCLHCQCTDCGTIKLLYTDGWLHWFDAVWVTAKCREAWVSQDQDPGINVPDTKVHAIFPAEILAKRNLWSTVSQTCHPSNLGDASRLQLMVA